MTVLQVLNSVFYLLIYPFLIGTLGAESYGLYVFAVSIVTYFTLLISFGFDLPAVKAIAQHRDNPPVKSNIVSSVLTAKLYLFAGAAVLFFAALIAIRPMREHGALYAICFGQVIPAILLPAWYFQGMQKMGTVTVIQLLFKAVSIPFIFWLVQSPSDSWIFAAIVTLTGVLGGAAAMFILRNKEKIRFRIVSRRQLKPLFKDGLPFFWSSSAGAVRQQSVVVIIGACFSMTDVALYDLANKIILLPQLLVMNINNAIFPGAVNNLRASTVKKILRCELLIGLAAIASVAVAGKWVVHLFGGAQMAAAYPLAVILSAGVLTWMIVSCYNLLVFVPQNRYYYVTRSQLVVLAAFLVFCGAGIVIFKNIWAVAAALSLAHLCEVAYCNIIIKQKKLLRV
jgi:PST family polysaccharide transporter